MKKIVTVNPGIYNDRKISRDIIISKPVTGTLLQRPDEHPEDPIGLISIESTIQDDTIIDKRIRTSIVEVQNGDYA